jgi:site-specific recombinase XerD
MITREIDQFIAEVCAGKDNETPLSYRSKLMQLDRWMNAEHIHLCQLRSKHLESFKQCLQRRKLSPFTIHTILITVRHFLKWAHRSKLIRDLYSRLKVPSTPHPEPKAISEKAALDLLDAASTTGQLWERARNLALIYILRDSAGRIGAIIHADIDELDLLGGKLLVREKGNHLQYLYLNPPSILALCEWLKHRPELHPKDRKIFISQYGRGLKRNSVYSILRRIKENAPIIQGRSNPHSFRHAWARDALTAGEDITKVARTLGNSVRVTAEYYALWNDAEIQQAHRQFSPGAKLPIIKPKK